MIFRTWSATHGTSFLTELLQWITLWHFVLWKLCTLLHILYVFPTTAKHMSMHLSCLTTWSKGIPKSHINTAVSRNSNYVTVVSGWNDIKLFLHVFCIIRFTVFLITINALQMTIKNSLAEKLYSVAQMFALFIISFCFKRTHDISYRVMTCSALLTVHHKIFPQTYKISVNYLPKRPTQYVFPQNLSLQCPLSIFCLI